MLTYKVNGQVMDIEESTPTLDQIFLDYLCYWNNEQYTFKREQEYFVINGSLEGFTY